MPINTDEGNIFIIRRQIMDIEPIESINTSYTPSIPIDTQAEQPPVEEIQAPIEDESLSQYVDIIA